MGFSSHLQSPQGKKVGFLLILLMVAILYAMKPRAQRAVEIVTQTDKKVEYRNEQELVEKAQRGGLVILFRHAKRDRKALPSIPPELDNEYRCIPGTNLTEEGKEQARKIKSAIAALSIGVDEVIISPTCRTREMAQIIFGHFREDRAVAYLRMLSKDELSMQNESLKNLFSEPPKSKLNRILVGHEGVLERLELPHLDEGDAGVIEPQGHGKFHFLGIVSLQKWMSFAPSQPKGICRQIASPQNRSSHR